MRTAPHGPGPIRALWITWHADTHNSVRPEAELALGLARAGVQMHVMTQGDSPYAAAFQAAGLRLTDFAPRGRFDPAGAAVIRDYCLREGIELMHLRNNYAIGTGLMATRGLPLRIVSCRDRSGHVHRWNPLDRLTHLSPRIDKIVCPAEAVREYLSRRRDPASLATIYPGHELAWYDVAPVKLHELGVPPGGFAVAAVADYRPHKGIEYLVDATQWLPPDAPIHLLLIGAGHENRSVLERISRSPYRSHFHLLRRRHDVPALLAACAVSVLPSVHYEGLPRAVMESMACGVPPIVTRVGGLPELVVQGETGIIVRPRRPRELGEALRWLYEHPAERLAMGWAARARIGSEFNIARTIARHLELYRQLCRPGEADVSAG